MKRLLYLCAYTLALLILSCTSSLEEFPSNVEPPVHETPPNADCELVSFSLTAADNGLDKTVTFKVDASFHRVSGMYLTWIEKDNPSMLVPTFEISGKSAYVDGKEIISGQTALSFAEPFILTVKAENGDESEYEIDFNCPQINTELPVLRLCPDAPIVSKDVYVTSTADLFGAGFTSGLWSSSDAKIEVRGRGNSTWILPKKPYRIKFPEKVSPLGLNHAKAKSWVLLANDMDKSLIRDALGWVMSRILFNPSEGYHDPLAVLFTPCTQFINVYMDSEYLGLYLLTDQMERAKGRIEVDKLEASDGDDPNLIRGGYIIESSIHGEPAPVRFRSGYRNIQLDHKYPDDDNYHAAQYAYIENYILEAESALYNRDGGGVDDYKDPAKGWRKYFDERTLADFIIIKELCGDADGYISTYCYKRRDSDKIFFGPIWDVDKGWGNETRISSDWTDMLMIDAGFKMPGANGDDWFVRLWKDETFRAFVNARWQSKRAELVKAVKNAADDLTAAMPKAIEANYTRWPFYYQASTEAAMPAQTYNLEIVRIKNLTDSRAAALDKLFAR